ncbi:hypothetical protein IG631_20447 [Alternaria alternata]|nr:hypothetical protein IG631_20447 [Alternaria alternata]
MSPNALCAVFTPVPALHDRTVLCARRRGPRIDENIGEASLPRSGD